MTTTNERIENSLSWSLIAFTSCIAQRNGVGRTRYQYARRHQRS